MMSMIHPNSLTQIRLQEDKVTDFDRLTDKERADYWGGGRNRLVRYYFFVQRGLALVNEFRYLLLAIMGVYALLKMDNPWIMLVMFMVSIPVLLVLGWFYTFKMAKIMDFLNVKFSTHYGKYSIELQERQTRALETIATRQDTTSSNDI